MDLMHLKDNIRILKEKTSTAPEDLQVFVLILESLFNPSDKEESLVFATVPIIHQELVPRIQQSITGVWQWVIKHLPPEQWMTGELITPWLEFQQVLVEEKLLTPDFHHSFLYLALQRHYNSIGKEGIEIAKLLPLFICCARMIGYADKLQNGNYPYALLEEKIAAKRVQEREKLSHIIFLLRILSYLLFNFCTQEQRELLPFLIYYRSPTTAEEKRSELALFNWLTQKSMASFEFFAKTTDLINPSHSFNVLFACDEGLGKTLLPDMSDIIPKNRSKFLQKTTANSWWIYPALSKTSDKQETITAMIEILGVNFLKEKDKTYSGAQTYIQYCKNQLFSLPREERLLAHRAIYSFRLQKYNDQLNEERSDLIKEIKYEAVKLQRKALLGKQVEFTFWHRSAMKQGRLGEIISSFEAEEVALTTNCNL